ncbi:MAG: O-antigen ligase family protein [Candidatus Margulisiibacteriota bacterium]|nr:O-antigen ligase family protein [Candidatus Margulisiibacteriota bacterium]
MKNRINYILNIIKQRIDIILYAGLALVLYQIGLGIVKQNYMILVLVIIFIACLLVFLNKKKTFFLLILLIPFSFFLKLVLSLFLPGLLASVIGIYKDLLLFSLLGSTMAVIITKKQYNFKLSRMYKPVLIFIALNVILFLTNSSSLIAGLIGFRKTIIFTFMFFLTGSLIKSKEDIKILVNIVLAVGFILAIGAIIQWLFFPNLLHSATLASGGLYGYDISVSRAASFFQSANVLGFYLAFLASVLIASIFMEKDKKQLIICSVILMAFMVALLFTLSRGAWIAIVAGTAIWGIIKYKYLLKRAWLIVIVAVLAALMVLSSPLLMLRFQSIFDEEDISKQSRFEKAFSVYAFKTDNMKDFLFGQGLGTTGAVPEALASEDLKSGFIDFYYLELYNDIGIIGLGCFLWVMCCYLKLLFITERKTKDPYFKQLINGFIIATFTFLFSGFFTGVGASFEEASVFWTFMGVTVIIYNKSLEGERHENPALN